MSRIESTNEYLSGMRSARDGLSKPDNADRDFIRGFDTQINAMAVQYEREQMLEFRTRGQ